MKERSGRAVSVNDTVGLYLEEVSEHLLLTAEDEVNLARAMEAGRKAAAQLSTKERLPAAERARLHRLAHAGEEAKITFVRANLRLVISIAKRYTGRGLDLLDLIQEGNLGLIRAVEKFDWRKGFKFSTYATWWIRQAITRGLGNNARTIRLPVHMVDIVRTVQDTATTLGEALHRRPTVKEIAELSGLDEERVRAAMEAPGDTVSLDRPVGEDGDAELNEFVEDDRMPDPYVHAAEVLRVGRLREALGRLAPEEREVITLRFGLAGDDPKTLSDVGARFDMTRERVRQLESRALAKLRHPSSESDLEGLL